MSKRQLVSTYLQGRMNRRQFIKALCAAGVSAIAATAYAQSLGSAEAAALSGLHQNEAGFFVAQQDDKIYCEEKNGKIKCKKKP